MPPIQFGPVLPASPVDTRAARTTAGGPVRSEKTASPPSGVVISAALDPGAAPIDAERVALIRKAVETGTYPVVPARVADAIIAAGLLLRSGK